MYPSATNSTPEGALPSLDDYSDEQIMQLLDSDPEFTNILIGSFIPPQQEHRPTMPQSLSFISNPLPGSLDANEFLRECMFEDLPAMYFDTSTSRRSSVFSNTSLEDFSNSFHDLSMTRLLHGGAANQCEDFVCNVELQIPEDGELTIVRAVSQSPENVPPVTLRNNSEASSNSSSDTETGAKTPTLFTTVKQEAFDEPPSEPHSNQHQENHHANEHIHNRNSYSYSASYSPKPKKAISKHTPHHSPPSPPLHHDDARPRNYICATCGNAFLRRQDLLRHETTHSTERAFTCGYGCGATFARSDGVTRHMRKGSCAFGRAILEAKLQNQQ
ncbi:hypothetical protein HK100_001763 [Physocladia obscura]|uniref:C2H2-type domain-containing protein n=1 Tax=Physocladia obscura TaxID=109957 RepID=A0AAD5SYE5_9FUNG|nr:hypothetical protein HK100_001763 [Physocladia obscura]